MQFMKKHWEHEKYLIWQKLTLCKLNGTNLFANMSLHWDVTGNDSDVMNHCGWGLNPLATRALWELILQL